MDNNMQEGVVLGVDLIGCDPRKRDMASTSNPVHAIEERESKRFRISEDERPDYNENATGTCLRETSSAARPSSQFLNDGQFNGRPMMSNDTHNSSERWSNYNARGNSNYQARPWCRDGYVPNAGWSNEHARLGTYQNDRFNRQGVYQNYRAETTTWPNEHHRHGRYGSNTTWSDDWHNRRQTYATHRPEDHTRHERYGNHRAEDMNWRNEWNQHGRYGHQRQESYGGSRLHMPELSNENYRHGGNRYENTSSMNGSYRQRGHWNPQDSSRGRAPSYSTRGRAPSYSTSGRSPYYSARGSAPRYSARGSAPRYSARGRTQSFHERYMAMPFLKNTENMGSDGTVAPSSTEKLIVDSLPTDESEFSCRHPIYGESVHSDMNKFDESSRKQNDGGCCNIEGSGELKSELGISDCKTAIVKDDERLQNEQGQALENCVSQSETVNSVSSAEILSKPLDVLLPSPERPLASNSRKKLLILDINGLLADIIFPAPKDCKKDYYFYGRAIFKRPFCYNFLEFCFEKFHVGIWSSRTMKIIDGVVDYLLGNRRSKLVLCWDIAQCTPTNFKTIENKHKGLVFKDLKKIWENDDPQLPWKKGEFNASNTLLLDDSPYKSLLNPLHSAVFPKSYSFEDVDDYSLGPNGDLRVYLENLAEAEDVQKYVEQNPFGQKVIDETHSNWSFYSEVVSSFSNVASMKNPSESSCMPTNEYNNMNQPESSCMPSATNECNNMNQSESSCMPSATNESNNINQVVSSCSNVASMKNPSESSCLPSATNECKITNQSESSCMSSATYESNNINQPESSCMPSVTYESNNINQPESSCMPSASNESNDITGGCGHETVKEG